MSTMMNELTVDFTESTMERAWLENVVGKLHLKPDILGVFTTQVW